MGNYETKAMSCLTVWRKKLKYITMKKIYSILFFALFGLFSSCDKPFFVESVSRFWLKNNSSQLILVQLSYSYPDTAILAQEYVIAGLGAGDEKPFDSKKQWKDRINELPKDTLSIFIFSNDTLKKYGWETVRKDYKILARYDISAGDLEAANHKLTYPR